MAATGGEVPGADQNADGLGDGSAGADKLASGPDHPGITEPAIPIGQRDEIERGQDVGVSRRHSGIGQRGGQGEGCSLLGRIAGRRGCEFTLAQHRDTALAGCAKSGCQRDAIDQHGRKCSDHQRIAGPGQVAGHGSACSGDVAHRSVTHAMREPTVESYRTVAHIHGVRRRQSPSSWLARRPWARTWPRPS